MDDVTSDVGEVDPDDAPECATCGTRIVESADHRVVAWIADGEARRRHFCEPACRADWSN